MVTAQDVVQHLCDVASTGTYQLAILPASRNRKFYQTSISHDSIRKMPIPGLQVYPCQECKKSEHFTFARVGALTPGSKRDPFLLQIGISIVSSTKFSDLVAYHWTEVPDLITPKVMAEAPGIRENTAIVIIGKLYTTNWLLQGAETFYKNIKLNVELVEMIYDKIIPLQFVLKYSYEFFLYQAISFDRLIVLDGDVQSFI